MNFAGINQWTWNDLGTGTQLYYTTPTLYRLDLASSSEIVPAGTLFTITYDTRIVESVTSSLLAGPIVSMSPTLTQASFYLNSDLLPAAADGTEPRYFSVSITRTALAVAGIGPIPADVTPISLDCARAWAPLTTDVSYTI
ncbi:hypothetical protein HQQ81_12405 [Microbacteriaceae bacterium VKM Ac-2854]|nr:hypothetical protein [Microbacteriaceae bacterium VKM Ac-2854]